MISYDTDPYYHTLWDTKTGEKPFDVRTLTLRSFLSMVVYVTLRKTPHICTYDYAGAREAEEW